MEIWPNPASEKWTVQASQEIKAIEIYDATGRKIQAAITKERSTAAIDIRALPQGMYFLRVETDKDVFSKQAVKW